MKLDVEVLRNLSKEDFRVLTAVEMGMRNHEIVPAELVDRIAGLKHGGTYKVLRNCLKHKLVHHDSSKYDGFRLTYLGYDYLAIKALVNRGVIASIGRQIGVGKESDVFQVATEDGTILCMKLHRLGRTSFRAVKSKRDYLRHRRSFNWLYLSRLAALKEFAFMKALGDHGFPVPTAIDCNRHCVIMSLVDGFPLVQVKELMNPDDVFERIVGLVVRLAEHGLIHCDFNEFNIMINNEEDITVIDFPQMVSVSHRNAKMYFDRDIECIFKFFRKRYNITYEEDRTAEDGSGDDCEGSNRPSFFSVEKTAGFLDKELEASGFTSKEKEDMDNFIDGNGDDSDTTSEDDQTPVQQVVDGAEMDARTSGHEDIEQASSSSNHEAPTGSSNPGEEVDDEDSGTSGDEDDNTELAKRLSRQRKQAMASAQGRRRSLTSRNSNKDKGRRSTTNSKLQREACQW